MIPETTRLGPDGTYIRDPFPGQYNSPGPHQPDRGKSGVSSIRLRTCPESGPNHLHNYSRLSPGGNKYTALLGKIDLNVSLKSRIVFPLRPDTLFRAGRRVWGNNAGGTFHLENAGAAELGRGLDLCDQPLSGLQSSRRSRALRAVQRQPLRWWVRSRVSSGFLRPWYRNSRPCSFRASTSGPPSLRVPAYSAIGASSRHQLLRPATPGAYSPTSAGYAGGRH